QPMVQPRFDDVRSSPERTSLTPISGRRKEEDSKQEQTERTEESSHGFCSLRYRQRTTPEAVGENSRWSSASRDTRGHRAARGGAKTTGSTCPPHVHPGGMGDSWSRARCVSTTPPGWFFDRYGTVGFRLAAFFAPSP